MTLSPATSTSAYVPGVSKSASRPTLSQVAREPALRLELEDRAIVEHPGRQESRPIHRLPGGGKLSGGRHSSCGHEPQRTASANRCELHTTAPLHPRTDQWSLPDGLHWLIDAAGVEK